VCEGSPGAFGATANFASKRRAESSLFLPESCLNLAAKAAILGESCGAKLARRWRRSFGDARVPANFDR
jgi:hypothetical protein